MSLIFCDSFDHYTTIVSKWDFNGLDCTIRRTGVSRTGPGCLQINSAAFGPTKTFGHITDFLLGTCWFSNLPGIVMLFQNFDSDVGYDATCVMLDVLTDGSLRVRRGPGSGFAILGQSAAGLVNWNVYNSIAMESTIGLNATVRVWCNGALVLTLTGVNTLPYNLPGANYVNGATLMGPGGIPVCYHDDVYMLDCTVAPHNTYLGASRIYAVVPFENSAPLDWTPLAGTNFSEVAEIPPDDDTSYVFSGTVGNIDQYHYDTTGVPSGAQIQALQHVLDMKIDGGARSVGSDVAGVPASGVALTTNYVMYTWPYDLNPATSAPWVAGDFPLPAGPVVTA